MQFWHEYQQRDRLCGTAHDQPRNELDAELDVSFRIAHGQVELVIAFRIAYGQVELAA